MVDDNNGRLVREPMLFDFVKKAQEESNTSLEDDDDTPIVRDVWIIDTDESEVISDDDGVYEASDIIINTSDIPKEKELELVDVDLCYRIISYDSAMETFFREIVDWDEDEISLCVDGIKALVSRFQKNGFQFTNDQIYRIKKITGLEIVNRTDLSEEEIEKVTEFKKFFEIYVDDDLYDQYLKTRDLDATINGITKREINKRILKVLNTFKVNCSSLSEEFESRLTRFKIVQDGYHKFYLDETATIDPELEKRIISNIPEGLNDELMAYNLYIELNKQVALDSRFYITHQDREDEYNSRLNDANVSEVNPNNLICKSWSDMYYYLIKKYTNIECCIIAKTRDGGGHRYVMLLMDDGNTIAVDGTNDVYDNLLSTKCTDILRCKLGLPTANFALYDEYWVKNDPFRQQKKKRKDPQEIIQKIFKIIGTKEEIQELNELIQNNGFSTINKLKLLIDFVENRRGLDSISMRSLISNLTYLFFTEEENVKAYNYYKEVDNGQYEYISFIKYVNSETKEKIILLFDKEIGFIETTLEEIEEMLNSGKIKEIPKSPW